MISVNITDLKTRPSLRDPATSSQVLLAAVAVGVGATHPAKDDMPRAWYVEFPERSYILTVLG